jgi:hypothetical protein
MTEPIQKLLIAFPVAESMRTFIRAMADSHPLPSLYRTGAENRPCAACGMTLNVGPRLLDVMKQDSTAKVYCPLCLPYVTEKLGTRIEDADFQEMKNPEAGWEGEKKGS